jgi:hypothetical protein
LRFVVQFLPMKARTIQREGLTVFRIRYWHPVFAAWPEIGKRVIVRYHPEDLSRVFVTADNKTYVEARCADLRRPRISLWEQRHALKLMKARGQASVSEALIFKTWWTSTRRAPAGWRYLLCRIPSSANWRALPDSTRAGCMKSRRRSSGRRLHGECRSTARAACS